ncbi:hypothetical protein BVY01_05095, partial [bacterium I07]
MSLNLLYSLREGVVGLRRARSASVITVSTIAVTLTLFGIFLILTVNMQRMVQHFTELMALEVFIDKPLDERQMAELGPKISNDEGVLAIQFISREMALERFKEDFGDDPQSVLGENPLPASYQVRLKRGYQTASTIEEIASRLETIEGVDEVVYHSSLFQAVERYGRNILIIDAVILIVVFLSTTLLVANTMRLTLLSQKNSLRIMELVGATEGFIRRPYMIQGVLEGA